MIKKLCILVLSFVYVYFSAASASAMPAAQRKLYTGGIKYFDIAQCSNEGGSVQTSSGPVIGGDPMSIFRYLLGKTVHGEPLQDFHVAGILGNIKEESGFEPQRAQGIFDRLVPGENWQEAQGGGWGLVQWTPGSKIVDPTTAAGKDVNDGAVQLDFLLAQLNGNPPDGWDLKGVPFSAETAAGKDLIKTTDIAAATISFELKYERHAGGPQPHRVVSAQEILAQFKDGGGSTTTTPNPTPGPEGTESGLTAGSKVYILGDSITDGAAATYKSLFENKEVEVKISAVAGRSWKTPGNTAAGSEGTTGTGQEALDADVKKTGDEKNTDYAAIVIALGTNGYTGNNPIEEVITAVKERTDAPIYWVNVANVGQVPQVPDFNKALVDLAPGKYTIIDWAKVVDPNGDGTHDTGSLLGDGTHPNEAGYARLGELVVNAVMSGGVATPQGTVGDCSCSADDGAATFAGADMLKEKLQEVIDAKGADTTVAMDYGADGSVDVSIDGGKRMLTRSTYKVYVAYALMRAVEAGAVTLDDTTQADFNDMLLKSGNDSARRLAEKVGGTAAINEVVKEAGATNTDLASLGDGTTLSTSVSSADDFAIFLGKLQAKQLPGVAKPESYQAIIDAMTNQDAERRGIPAGITTPGVANKPGWGGVGGEAATNDVGIVSGTPTYSLAILTSTENDWGYVADLARTVSEGVGSGTDASSDCGGGATGSSGVVQGSVVQTALNLAWDTKGHGKNKEDAKPEYQAAFQEFYESKGGTLHTTPYSDCSVFVGTVMRASGVDPDFPLRTTWEMYDYVKANPTKYQIVTESLRDGSVLQPGDIMIDKPNHIALYVGDQPNGFPVVEASLGDRVPEPNTLWHTNGAYLVARPIREG